MKLARSRASRRTWIASRRASRARRSTTSRRGRGAAAQRAHAQRFLGARQILDGAPRGARVLVGVRQQDAGRRIAAREGALRSGQVGPRARAQSRRDGAGSARAGRAGAGSGDRERRGLLAHARLPDALERVAVGVLGRDHQQERRDRDLRVELGPGAEDQPDREADDEQQQDGRGRDAEQRDDADAEHDSRDDAEHAPERERERRVGARRGSRSAARARRRRADPLPAAARSTRRARLRRRFAPRAAARCGRPRGGHAWRETLGRSAHADERPSLSADAGIPQDARARDGTQRPHPRPRQLRQPPGAAARELPDARVVDDPRWGAVGSTVLAAVALVVAISDPETGHVRHPPALRLDRCMRGARAARPAGQLGVARRADVPAARRRCSSRPRWPITLSGSSASGG